jgi:hypothetical protein
MRPEVMQLEAANPALAFPQNKGTDAAGDWKRLSAERPRLHRERHSLTDVAVGDPRRRQHLSRMRGV